MNYFVTGATGFIGRHLVEQLLKREGTIYALVREGSRGRLDELATRLGAGDRLVPLVGDLSKEGLGVDPFDEKIDHFFHLAAVYDMDADDESMRRANVEGTRHVVQFANSLEVGLFHHTSSIAVAGKFKGLFREDMFDEGQKLPHAYHQTKFESENLARQELKAPFRVYRPGIVVGHSVTGEMDKVDGPYYFFKLIQRLRHALPEWFPVVGPEGKKVNIVPVDFVARAMDHIAHMPDDDLPGNTFHLVEAVGLLGAQPRPGPVPRAQPHEVDRGQAHPRDRRVERHRPRAGGEAGRGGRRGDPGLAHAREAGRGRRGGGEARRQAPRPP